MRGHVVAFAVLVVTLVPAVALAGASKGGRSLHATLKGSAEVPEKGPPAGRGSAEVKISGSQLCWEIKVSGIDRPTAAHIHQGRAGRAGAVVVPFGKAFKARGCTKATATTAAAISRNPGGYYVNVHTKRYPAGAVRGQLGASADNAGGIRY